MVIAYNPSCIVFKVTDTPNITVGANRGLISMAVRVVEFSNGRYKIRKIFAEESTYSKEIIEF